MSATRLRRGGKGRPPRGVSGRRCRDRGRAAARARRTAFAAAATAFAVAACSFDYPTKGADELAEQVPKTVLTGVTYRIVRDGRVRAVIGARQVEHYPSTGTAVLIGAHYTEFDDAGTVVATGSAQRAVYYTESEDAELAGAIDLRSESEQTAVHAGVLRWASKPRELSAPAGEVVELARDDGSQVRGAGFTADLRRKAVRFAAPVTGSFVVDGAEHE